MKAALLIDFGSTYTKAVAVDLESAEILGTSQGPTTVERGIMVGLHETLHRLHRTTGKMEYSRKLACSSAAGGLRMIAAGFVRELTAEAAQRAALGAGAKVHAVFSDGLDEDDVNAIRTIDPEIVLLSGGTDGGNREILLHNAGKIAAVPLRATVVVAGNRKAGREACRILREGGREVVLTDNVMPALNVLNVEPAREAIRSVFMKRIVSAKGLDDALSFVDGILMPTPMAVLRAARFLAGGVHGRDGMGDLMVVDVGGATTDIHSVADGAPTGRAVWKGLPEPREKRTVEGDLGLRCNAASVLGKAGGESILRHAGLQEDDDGDLRNYVARIVSATDHVPACDRESAFDKGLAKAAVSIAMARHAGSIEEAYFADGRVEIQKGKDLTAVKTVIGTGGVFSRGTNGFDVLEGARYDRREPFSLRPRQPDLYLDHRYILFAVGLLLEAAPETAFRVAVENLKKRPSIGGTKQG